MLVKPGDARVVCTTQAARAALVGEEAVLLNLKRGTYYRLNETGAWIWQRIDGIRTLLELSEAMTAEYDISLQEAWSDVNMLVRDLQEEGLVTVDAPSAGSISQISKADVHARPPCTR